MKLKLDLKTESIQQFTGGTLFKLIVKSLLFALIAWLIIFVLETIFVSGGLATTGAPFIVTELIAILVVAFFYIKKMQLNQKELIISLVSIVLAYAILDFLVVNLFLQKNDLSIYKFWPYYLKFVLLFLVPFIWSKKPDISALNLKLPLTKKS